MGGLLHRFLTAGDDDIGIAIGDLLHADRDGAKTRSAELIEGPGGLFLRHARLHGSLTGRILTLTGGQNLAHDDLVDLAWLDLCPLHGRLDRGRAELMGRRVGEAAVERAYCR